MVKMKTRAPEPDGIDFGAALPSQQDDDDLKVAMRTLRSGKPIPTSYPIKEKTAKPARRPKGAKRQPQAPPSSSNTYIYKKDNLNIGNDGDMFRDIKDIDKVNIKDKLTSQELRFLEIYLSSDHIKGGNKITIDKAMILAGYGHFTQDWRYKLAKKIVIKYERSGGGAAQVFKDIGFSAVRVALGIAQHAESAKSESVSLNALALAARCQGMTEQREQGSTGIIININTGPSPGPGEAKPAPARVVIPGGEDQATAPPRRPLQISR